MLSSAIEFNLLTVVTPSGRHAVGPSRRLAVAPLIKKFLPTSAII